MDSNLINFVDRCLGIAVVRQLDASNDVIIKIANPDGTEGEFLLVCSYDEPTGILPLNVLWIDADTASADYKQVYKRLSKDPANGYSNTWQEINTIAEAFGEQQYYDAEDLPVVESSISDINQHILLVGADDPHGMVGYVQQKVGKLENDMFSFMLFVNAKADANKQKISELELGQRGVVERVTALEQQPSIPRYIHTQEEPITSWRIEHNLGSNAIITKFIDSEGELILPDYEDTSDENIMIVSFSEVAVAGQAFLVAL